MKQKNKGVSLIEILVGMGITAILGSISITVFSGLAHNISLDRDVNVIVSYIDKARTMSINSVDSLPHGVIFETNKITVFKSATYSVANTEAFYDVPAKTRISSINLTGGATSLYFDKLTGAPNKTGTVTVSLVDGSKSKTITIYATGIVDIQ